MSAAQQSKKKPAAAPALPTYNVMIKTAIGALKERKGSLHQAITKYITANYKVSSDADRHVRTQLPKLADVKKELTRRTGKGASGSFERRKSLPKAKRPPLAVRRHHLRSSPQRKRRRKEVCRLESVKQVAIENTNKQSTKNLAKKPAANNAGGKKKVGDWAGCCPPKNALFRATVLVA